jgi:hypothetical protein
MGSLESSTVLASVSDPSVSGGATTLVVSGGWELFSPLVSARLVEAANDPDSVRVAGSEVIEVDEAVSSSSEVNSCWSETAVLEAASELFSASGVITVAGSESDDSASDSTTVDEESTSVTMAVELSAGVEVSSAAGSDVEVSSKESEVKEASSADVLSGAGVKVEVRSSTVVDSGSSSWREVDEVSAVGASDTNVLETSDGDSESDSDT